MFIVFDGIDGAGKSTQIARLAEWFQSQGQEVECCADPGTTRLGNQLRDLLLNKRALEISPVAEMLMFMTARAQMVAQTIRPALDAGRVVICDRFVMATIVYQGHANQVDVDAIRQVGKIATGGLQPDMTLVLDLPVEAAQRRNPGCPDRVESRGTDYFLKVRSGFQQEVKLDPQRCFLIDASPEPDEVFGSVVSLVERHLAGILDPRNLS